jgi:GT2 family glycosyltransferase
MRLSAVVPTYGRDEVLVATLERLLALAPPPEETIVVDQTPEHGPAVERQLAAWEAAGRLRWHRRARPSIPAAMNDGLLAATGDVVLFLDDDVEPSPGLVAAHRAAHAAEAAEIVAGQVLQPGEATEPLAGERFAFRSSLSQDVAEFMGGNFSVRRRFALDLGGFDESFVGAAYRFEADFAARARAAGGRIRFEPSASLRHLRAERGGTRAFGSHLTTLRPAHAVGEYYHLLRNRPPGAWRRLLARPWRSIRTRHHLRRPWWIPVTLAAELGGLAWALRLALTPRRLLAGRGEKGP